MIVQYKLRLVRAERTALPSCLAYRLYAWLLDQIPREEAACFHDQTQQALTQYLERDGVWTVNLFGDDAVEQLGCVLNMSNELYCTLKSLPYRIGRSGQ